MLSYWVAEHRRDCEDAKRYLNIARELARLGCPDRSAFWLQEWSGCMLRAKRSKRAILAHMRG